MCPYILVSAVKKNTEEAAKMYYTKRKLHAGSLPYFSLLFHRVWQIVRKGGIKDDIQGGSDKSGIFFFLLLNGTTQLKIIRFY